MVNIVGKLKIKEKDLMKSISQRLSIYELTGEILWHTRLNSGSIKTMYGSYMKLAKKGTPDYLALVRAKDNNLVALFLEAKSSTGKLRPDQVDFQKRYGKNHGIYVMTIYHIQELDKWIDKYAINKVNLLPDNLKDL